MAVAVGGIGGSGNRDNPWEESDSESDDERACERPRKVMFVRCLRCRNEKGMCEACKKRQNREASRRNREKHARNQEALEHLRTKIRTLKAQHRDDRTFIRQLITAGAHGCQRCGGRLMNRRQETTASTSSQDAPARVPFIASAHRVYSNVPQMPTQQHDHSSTHQPTLAELNFDSDNAGWDLQDLDEWLYAINGEDDKQ